MIKWTKLSCYKRSVPIIRYPVFLSDINIFIYLGEWGGFGEEPRSLIDDKIQNSLLGYSVHHNQEQRTYIPSLCIRMIIFNYKIYKYMYV